MVKAKRKDSRFPEFIEKVLLPMTRNDNQVSIKELIDEAIRLLGVSKTAAYRYVNDAVKENLAQKKGDLISKKQYGTPFPGTEAWKIQFHILEGTYENEFRSKQLDFQWSGNERNLFEDYPVEIKRHRDSIITSKKAAADRKNAPFYNGKLCRLDRWTTVRNENKTLSKMVLYCSETRYFDFQASNCSLNEHIGTNKTLWTEYTGDPWDLDTSKLSNPIAVVMAVNVNSNPKELVFAHRAMNLVEYPNTYSAAVAGSTNLIRKDKNENLIAADLTEDGLPDIFASVKHEAHEEIGIDEQDIHDIFFFGLGRDLRNYKPMFLGVLSLKISFKELQSKMIHNAKHKENKMLLYFNLDNEYSRRDFLRKLVVEPYPQSEAEQFDSRFKSKASETAPIPWAPDGQVCALWSFMRNYSYKENNEMVKEYLPR